MKPFINIEDLTDYISSSKGKYEEKYCSISNKIGALKLGYSISQVPPGKRVCPFHNHRINEEMFFILEGQGTLRFGSKEYSIKKNDVISCPPGGPDVAHQIINTGKKELKYLCLSTKEPYDICEYPDSKKMLAMVNGPEDNSYRHICNTDKSIDYFDGEL